MNSGPLALRVIYRIQVASTGPRVARGIVAAEFSGRVRERKLDDLKLLVSELITHRVRQGRAGETITLDLRAGETQTGETVRCGVIDDGPVALPGVLGMRLVGRLATRWGVSRERHRTHTWAEAGIGVSPAPG
jgi:hypothetical protein